VTQQEIILLISAVMTAYIVDPASIYRETPWRVRKLNDDMTTATPRIKNGPPPVRGVVAAISALAAWLIRIWLPGAYWLVPLV